MKKQITYFLLALTVVVSADGTVKDPTSAEKAPTRKERNKGRDHGHGILSLDVFVDSNTIHSLLGKKEAGSESVHLFHQKSEDKGKSWSSLTRVNPDQLPVFGAHRSMDPQIAASADKLVATWMVPGKGRFGSGPMVSVTSQDGGKTWQPGGRPADPEALDGQGFIDISTDKEGAFNLVWLDSRGKGRGLRYTRSDDGGKTWIKNQTIDEVTCECCWNIIRTTNSGDSYVLYRDVGPRDMALAIGSASKGWRRASRVGEFDWDFQGCPHVGGGLAIDNSRDIPQLHSVVWTGNTPHMGFHYLRSRDNGKNWSEPMSFGSEDAKHGDIAINEKGHLLITWNELVGENNAVFLSTSTDRGETWTSARQISLPNVNTEYPRTVSIDEEFFIFWTEKKDGVGQWKMSAL